MSFTKFIGAAAGAAVLLVATGCAATTNNAGEGGGEAGTGAAEGVIVVGTTDKTTSLDPAGEYDNGSFNVLNQIYPFLMNTPVGATDMTPQPDIAESAEYISDMEYQVKLKPGLTFANGNKLTCSDVKFSFDRMVGINDPNGPASLLPTLKSTSCTDDTTVVFNLSVANDVTFPSVLTSPVGLIVDEEVFPADKIMADNDIVAAKPFAGPYSIDSFKANELISFVPFDGYQGILGKAANKGMNWKFYGEETNMKLDIEKGNIDVAYRSLSPTDAESLRNNKNVSTVEGPGGELRFMVFNIDTMPFGAKSDSPDPAKAAAVKKAMASLIDREAISTEIYKGTYTPAYSVVPSGMNWATEDFKAYGDGNGGPSLDAATKYLKDAGVETPVALSIQYNPDHYGKSSGDEYAMIKSQLEEGGLFTVDLQSTEWVQYNKDRVADVYPIYQLGWFPDYSDPDNYITPFFGTENFIQNHYSNAEVDKLIPEQIGATDSTQRGELIGKLQKIVSEDISTLPLLQGAQVAFTSPKVKGLQLDASFKFRANAISK